MVRSPILSKRRTHTMDEQAEEQQQQQQQQAAEVAAVVPPNQTLYIRNLNEKVKKEGTLLLFVKALFF